MIIKILLLALTVGTGGVQVARAQTAGDAGRSSPASASYYNFTEPGDVAILANVWGTVRNPGLYEVARGTHLSTLFSVAGGPQIAPRSRRDRRAVVVRLYRAGGSDGSRAPLFETTLENGLLTTNEDPVLEDGDLLMVETVVHQPFNWRNVLPFITAASTLALAYDRFFN